MEGKNMEAKDGVGGMGKEEKKESGSVFCDLRPRNVAHFVG